MKIALIQGHPDRAGGHFCHALASAYAQSATKAGHQVKVITVAELEFTWVHDAGQWEHGPVPEAIGEAQRTVAWADHLLIVFPLWLGDMPAVLKAFFEQVLRPGFALGKAEPGRMGKKLLKGRSARIVVTMGMPAFFYSIYYRAHGVKSLRRNVLEFCGISPVRTTLIGTVEGRKDAREKWLAKLSALGVRGNG